MVSSRYPIEATTPPLSLTSALAAHKLAEGESTDTKWEEMIKIMTLEELLPMSFGPEQLGEAR